MWVQYGEFNTANVSHVSVSYNADKLPNYVVNTDNTTDIRGFNNYTYNNTDGLLKSSTRKIMLDIVVYRNTINEDKAIYNSRISKVLYGFRDKHKQTIVLSDQLGYCYKGVAIIKAEDIVVTELKAIIKVELVCDQSVDTAEVEGIKMFDSVLTNANILIQGRYAYDKSFVNSLTDLINYNGTMETYPVILLKIASTSSTQQILKVNNDIIILKCKANDRIKIDGMRQTITINGIENTYNINLPSGRFPVLEYGKNSISLDNCSGSISMKYNERYEYTFI